MNTIPKLAMINDLAGFGRCSTTVSLPVISALQVQVCPVPTSILSNHLGFPTCYFDDYTGHIRDYLHGWEQLGIIFDGLYCGFLGSVKQIDIVEELLAKPMTANALFLLDPVMGDHGKAYSTITPELINGMKRLLRHAHILTPNITEACLLTDTPYRENGWTREELITICEQLANVSTNTVSTSTAFSSQSPDCLRRIVITGLKENNCFRNFIWENGKTSIYESPAAGASRPGTGDLFASILVADALNQIPFAQSVQHAADFVALCIRGSEAAGIPIQEGVIFEKYMYRLIENYTK